MLNNKIFLLSDRRPLSLVYAGIVAGVFVASHLLMGSPETLSDVTRGGRIVRKMKSSATGGDEGRSPLPAPILKIELNKESYVDGDEQLVTVRVPVDGYLYVASIWADGNVYVYFPNSDHPDPQVKAGEIVKLPDSDKYSISMHYPLVEQDVVYEQVLAILNPVLIPEIQVDEEHSQTEAFKKQKLVSPDELFAVRGGKLQRPVQLEKNVSRLTAAGVYRMTRKK